MIKRVSLISFLMSALILAACGGRFGAGNDATETPRLSEAATAEIILVPDLPAVPSATVGSQAVSTQAATPIPTPSLEPAPSPTPFMPDLSIAIDDIFLYPVPAIYAGDKVTFQLWPTVPESISPENVTVQIMVDGAEVTRGALSGNSHLSGEAVGLFEWAWDTTAMVGSHQIQVTLDQEDTIKLGDEDPNNNAASLVVMVLDPQARSTGEPAAIWKTATSDCCLIHVVSGTAADRDLPQLLPLIDQAAIQASAKLGEDPQKPIDIYLIDRVIGQGGYASSGIVVSYLDRDYTGNDLQQVMVHELVHLLDRQFAPQRISFLAEGLAVWASEGHYKDEDIDQAIIAMRNTDLYLVLPDLINDFYPSQHETAYFQAAGFVSYLINTYGWWPFRDFYIDVSQDKADSLAEAVDQSLQAHFGQSLADVEASWIEYLDGLTVDPSAISDVQTTVHYYEVMRRYQLQYDPTAHFLKAWMPSPSSVLELGSPADLNGHPETEQNIALEVMFGAADRSLKKKNYARANVLLNSIERVLESDGQFLDPFSMNYWRIVQTVSAEGYVVNQVTLSGDTAVVIAAKDGRNTLEQLKMTLNGQEWILAD